MPSSRGAVTQRSCRRSRSGLGGVRTQRITDDLWMLWVKRRPYFRCLYWVCHLRGTRDTDKRKWVIVEELQGKPWASLPREYGTLLFVIKYRRSLLSLSLSPSIWIYCGLWKKRWKEITGPENNNSAVPSTEGSALWKPHNHRRRRCWCLYLYQCQFSWVSVLLWIML